jgi:imidazolonepropionase-like amidohydrolase
MVQQVRGIVLPDGEERSYVLDGETLREDRSGTGELIGTGWILPGLVDVHTHPGTEEPGDVFSDAALREHLLAHRDAGVLLLRTPGSAARIPDWVATEPGTPRVRSAGRWLATPGRFFPGYGRDVTEDGLAAAALEENAAGDAWCKVIVDWGWDKPPVSPDALAATVTAVHAAGGRVAAHCQTTDGCRVAVEAGVDSLEHGMHLDRGLLSTMAAQGTALVPTLTAFGDMIDVIRARESSGFRDWFVRGWDGMAGTVRAAHESGVTVLAGTDSMPFGRVCREVEWLARAGLPPAVALAAASWTARSWLGLPGLTDGAPADFVLYDSDPTLDPAVLGHPSLVVLRGQVVRPGLSDDRGSTVSRLDGC